MKVLDAVVWLVEPSGENIERVACSLNVDLVMIWLRIENMSANITKVIHT
jgi:hypothetical protein